MAFKISTAGTCVGFRGHLGQQADKTPHLSDETALRYHFCFRSYFLYLDTSNLLVRSVFLNDAENVLITH